MQKFTLDRTRAGMSVTHNQSAGRNEQVIVDADSDGLAFNGKPVLTQAEAAANLNRTGAIWDTGPKGVITYSFAEHKPGGQYNSPKNAGDLGLTVSQFSSFTPEQRTAARQAIGLWDDLISVKFVEKNGAGADIIYMNTGEGGPAQAAAYTPFYAGTHGKYGKIQGDVFVDGLEASNFEVAPGGYGQTTLVHETGHAIGLSHPGDYNFGADTDGDGVSDPITYANSAYFFQDSYEYTIMSYFSADNTGSMGYVNWGTGGYYQTPQTPMLDDISAVQAIYGVDTTTRLGSTTYGFNSTAGKDVYDFTTNKNPFLTIYDAGGAHDKLDLTGWSVDVELDLNPGHFSSGYINGDAAQLNDLWGTSFSQAVWDAIYAGKTANPGFLSDNIGIAYNTIIEDGATGSGRDLLVGNAVGNILDGGAGDDTYTGGAGSDIFAISQLGYSDTITDFVHKLDHIDLRALDASTAKAGDQAFRFVGTNAFSAAGDLHLSTDSAGINTLAGDVNGDHVADFVINLGHSVVSASDIFL